LRGHRDTYSVVERDALGGKGSMGDAFCMKVLHTLSDLFQDLGLGGVGEIVPILVQSSVQRVPFHFTHHDGERSTSHVETDTHEELDILVADAAEGRHLLQEIVKVLYLPCCTHVHMDTPMPVATVNNFPLGARYHSSKGDFAGRNFPVLPCSHIPTFQAKMCTCNIVVREESLQ